MNILVRIIVRLLGGFWQLKQRIMRNPHGLTGRIYKILYYSYLRGYGSYIGWKTVISGPICLPHGFYGIFIAGGSKIGKNCVIFQQVTIGQNSLPFSKTAGFPTIGDNCYIGAGAKIIGGIRIGNNCRIGANCTVVSDIPDNSLVVSQQPKIIPRDGMDNKFYRESQHGPEYFQDGKWVLEEDEEVIKRLEGKL
jgi:serine O-acetyltransferase